MTPMNQSAATRSSTQSKSNSTLSLITAASLTVALASLLFSLYLYRHRPIWVQIASNDATVNEKFLVNYYSSNVWMNTKWLGVESAQTPTDNWSMQEIISEVKPDYIIETGTLNGGTTAFYAAVLSFVNDNGKVITIDIEPHVEDASKLKVWKDRVELITASSVDPKVTDHIAQEVQGKKVLVTLDSLHTRDHVLKEMEAYSKLVSPGSYLVVQDTSVNGHPLLPDWGPGPMEAVQDFLKTHDNFIVDRSREKFLLTFYPGGWLKRVK
jgi:cephalosporin hydroxylase